jgi:predicted N-acyltransferase
MEINNYRQHHDYHRKNDRQKRKNDRQNRNDVWREGLLLGSATINKLAAIRKVNLISANRIRRGARECSYVR